LLLYHNRPQMTSKKKYGFEEEVIGKERFFHA